MAGSNCVRILIYACILMGWKFELIPSSYICMYAFSYDNMHGLVRDSLEIYLKKTPTEPNPIHGGI